MASGNGRGTPARSVATYDAWQQGIENQVLPRIFDRLDTIDSMLGVIDRKLDIVLRQNKNLEQATKGTRVALHELVSHQASLGAASRRMAEQLDEKILTDE